ncbi:hypothetical protein VCB98_08595 [Gammaproteobacteria bacterium AB-CW1]|uniref:Uncharacterized protein n=1 Tax=Natronospira elongata TaxID=3110268 RepID=A0AAP6MLG3_9GAMM|nr:hypothetical protein [Gammaproteobacteria bacterium AB-CW1]
MNQLHAMYSLIRRELWEHKSLWIAPAVTAALFLVASVWGFISLVSNPTAVEQFNQHVLPQMTGDRAFDVAHGMTRASAFTIYAVMVVVLFFYALDCLYSERRDRSILFWRSLPVSDTLTVLSKLLVVLLVAPVIVLLVGLALEVLGLLLAPILVMGTDMSFGDYLQPLAALSALFGMLGDMWLLGLWFLPYFGWLFLVSAWARKAAFLWAVLPPLGVALVEWVALSSREFLKMIGHHISLPFQNAQQQDFGFRTGDLNVEASAAEITGLAGFAEPAFWIGLAVGVAFIAAAVAIRRYRGETA